MTVGGVVHGLRFQTGELSFESVDTRSVHGCQTLTRRSLAGLIDDVRQAGVHGTFQMVNGHFHRSFDIGSVTNGAHHAVRFSFLDAVRVDVDFVLVILIAPRNLSRYLAGHEGELTDGVAHDRRFDHLRLLRRRRLGVDRDLPFVFEGDVVNRQRVLVELILPIGSKDAKTSNSIARESTR